MNGEHKRSWRIQVNFISQKKRIAEKQKQNYEVMLKNMGTHQKKPQIAKAKKIKLSEKVNNGGL